MALGAVTVIANQAHSGVNFIVCDVQLTSGANYTTNGEPFDVAQIPGAHGQLLAVIPQPGHSVGGPSAQTVWDQVNKKLKAYGTAGGGSGLTEIAANTNLSGQVTRCVCFTTGIG